MRGFLAIRIRRAKLLDYETDNNESVSEYRAVRRWSDLTGVVHEGLSNEAKQLVFAERRQPRSKDKPVIR